MMTTYDGNTCVTIVGGDNAVSVFTGLSIYRCFVWRTMRSIIVGVSAIDKCHPLIGHCLSHQRGAAHIVPPELCRGGRDSETFAFPSPPRKSPEPFRVRLLSNERAGPIFVVEIRERPLILAIEHQKEPE
jgi:hypothetical protein